MKKLCSFTDFIYLCPRNAYPCEGGYVKTYIDGTRPQAICTASLEGRFRTLLSVFPNLANLNLYAAVMQLRASTWVDFISTYGYHPLYIYNKVYTPTKVHALCVYIPGVDSVDMYILELLWPWCVYIIAGVGRLYVAYP